MSPVSRVRRTRVAARRPRRRGPTRPRSSSRRTACAAACAAPPGPRPPRLHREHCAAARRGPRLDEGGESWGRGAYLGLAPLPEGRTYLYAATSTDAVPDRAPVDPAAASPGCGAASRAGTTRSPRCWPRHGPRLLVHPVEDLRPPASWCHGRVALLGDAAHAMAPNLGQGASQAFLDAVALGEEAVRRTASPPTRPSCVATVAPPLRRRPARRPASAASWPAPPRYPPRRPADSAVAALSAAWPSPRSTARAVPRAPVGPALPRVAP